MAAPRSLKVLLLFLVVPSFAWAQKYPDPDSPAVQAAAVAALPHAKILNIVGITLGIEGVLKDLGAKIVGQQIKIELAADVLFDFDKFNLRPEATDTLQKVGQVVKSYPNSPVLIEGHTDSKGDHAYNIKLSENRALSVKNWLVQNAATQAGLITTRGWAETKPVAPNTNSNGSDNPEGRQKNRRVELTLTASKPL